MFSDSFLPLKISCGLIILMLLGIYSHQHGEVQDRNALGVIIKCTKSPSLCGDLPLVLRVKTKVWSNAIVKAEVQNGGRYLSKFPIYVSNLAGKRSVGRIVDVLGAFDDHEQFIVVRQREDDWIQNTKYAISLVGLGLCLYLFIRLYTLSCEYRLPLIPRHPNKRDA